MTNVKSQKPTLVYNDQSQSFECSGSWSILDLNHLVDNFLQSPIPKVQNALISGAKINHFDSAGALALINCENFVKSHGINIERVKFHKEQLDLLSLVTNASGYLDYKPKLPAKENLFAFIGREAIYKWQQFKGLTTLIGEVSWQLYQSSKSLKRLHFSSIVANINETGIRALPIIALLSFLIGIVLAYQLGLQLQTYGANTFIAYLSGMAIFREFAPLITAIIVAGRTSSAFTSQIGSMKINEEIDALRTMGLSPIEYIVLPKVLGLFIIFPLLIFWSDIFNILGALIMSKWMLNISYFDFITRLRDTIGLKQLMLGLYKAPAFSILIALVGCFQGFQVVANNIGPETTKSVVQALFLIIIADAAFSIIYSWLDL